MSGVDWIRISRRFQLPRKRTMSVSVQIPTVLRPDCGGASELSVAASTVRAALAQLEQQYPALYRNVCNETGAVRQHVNLFVNDDFLHQRDGLDTVLNPGDVLTIMPAVSGG
jgi:molybdopterin converting factor small subunit